MEGGERNVSMKRLAILVIFTVLLILFTGCSPKPSSGQQPDDIVTTPGGMAYRANVHEQGKPDFWPPVEVSTVVLADNVTIYYRSDIETEAGELRNNIVSMGILGRHDLSIRDLNLSISNLPAGIAVREGESSGGLPGTIARVIIIEISQEIKPGEYTFEINVEFEGKDYGQIPCTINVVES